MLRKYVTTRSVLEKMLKGVQNRKQRPILAAIKAHIITKPTDPINCTMVSTKQLTNNSMGGTKPHTSILTLNVNCLNAPYKRHRVAKWIKKKKKTTFCCP